MQTFIQPGRRSSGPHTVGVRVLLLTEQPDGLTAQRLVDYRSLVDCADDLEGAVASLLDDPMGYDLFVMDCDGFGGIAAAERAVAKLIAGKARMRVMLLSREFDAPAYPMGRRTAVCLPDEVSETSFRIGFDHALRDRAAVTMN